MIRQNAPDELLQYIEHALASKNILIPDTWKTWLSHPETLAAPLEHLPDSLSRVMRGKTDTLLHLATTYQKAVERLPSSTVLSGTVHLHHIEWSWILNYNQNNRFDFDTQEHAISILNAKNGFGKSNFLEIICLALFGEGFPSRYNKHYSSGVICDKKPSGTMACTMIRFTLQNKTYTLKRVLKSNHDKRAINFHEVILSECEANGTSIQGQHAVSQWIENHLGSSTSFLMTTMLSQQSDGDFFSMEKSKQKMLLDQLLSVDHIQTLQLLLREASTYYHHLRELIESYHAGISHTQRMADPSTPALLATLQEEHQKCLTQRAALHSKWMDCSERALLSVSSMESLQSECIAIQSELHSLPSETLSVLQDQLTSVEHRRRNHQRELTRLHSFSDLPSHPPHDSAGMSLDDHHEKVRRLQDAVEAHPFFPLYSIYESIDAPSAPSVPSTTECLEEHYRIVQEFTTWNTIQQERMNGYHPSHDAPTSLTVHESKKIIEEHPSLLKTLQRRLFLSKRHLSKATAHKDKLMEKRPNRPTVTAEWMKSIEQDIQKMGEDGSCIQKFQHSIQTIPSVCQAIKTLSAQINEKVAYLGECASFPFNARCKSCRIQPWKVQADAFQNDLPALRASLEQHQVELSRLVCTEVPFALDSSSAYVSELQALQTLYQKHAINVERYRAEASLFENDAAWNALYEVSKKEMEDASKLVERNTMALRKQTDQMNRALMDVSSYEASLERRRTQQLEYEAYQLHYAAKYDEYQTSLTILQDSWHTRVSSYRKWIAAYCAELQHHAQCDAVESTRIQQRILDASKKEQLMPTLYRLSTLLDAYPSWMEWKSLEEVERSLSSRIHMLTAELRGATVGHSAEDVAVWRIMDRATQYGTMASSLDGLLDGYRKWMYTTHIAPLLHLHVNRVLSMMCDGLQLESEWLDTIDSLLWFIRDGTCRVILEKASGFQRFIVGIAMRVALPRIGFCRIHYDQLFMDEGFTACDSDHLEHVPAFLHRLLPLYHSIYLITHLDALKACSPHPIYITRVDGLSHLHHPADAVIQEPIKKRGRPPKAAVTVTHLS